MCIRDRRYRFVTSRGEVSREYECPILRELTFTPADARIEKERQIIFQTDTQAYKIELSDTPCIRVIVEDNLTVKTNEIHKNAEQMQKELTAIAGDGTPLLRILPELCVMVDEQMCIRDRSGSNRNSPPSVLKPATPSSSTR